MVKGAGMKPGGTAGKYIATQAVISGIKAVSPEEEETDENAGVESARLVERETEDALRGLRHAQIRSKRTDVKTHRRGYREATVEKKLKFGSAESMEGVKNAETVKKAEQKRHFYNRFFQKKRYKDAYRAARAGKSADSLGGAKTNMGAMATILILALGGVAAYYYFKIYKPKKEEDEDDQPEGLETGGLEEVPDEEESEDEDFEENEK